MYVLNQKQHYMCLINRVICYNNYSVIIKNGTTNFSNKPMTNLQSSETNIFTSDQLTVKEELKSADNDNTAIAPMDIFAKENLRRNSIQQRLKQSFELLHDKVFSVQYKSKNMTGARTENSYWKRMFISLEEVIHMDEVRRAQERVISIKNQLHEAGNKKRALQKNLDAIRLELNKVYKDFKINRNSGQYLELVKQEVDLYTQTDELQRELNAADEHEQYLFNAFSVAINDSYEKEKIHSNMIKVLGILGTIFGSLITFVLSVAGLLYNQKKFYTLRQDVESVFTDQVMQKLDAVTEDMQDYQRMLTELQQVIQKPTESWGSYLNRHTRWTYSWAMPKK